MADVVGRAVPDGYLASREIAAIAREGLGRLALDARRVLVIIPDGTRTMPMPLMFEPLERELGPRVAALDYLVALGTHSPMSDEQLSRHGRTHRSSTAAQGGDGSSITVGTIHPRLRRSARFLRATSSRSPKDRLNQDVPVALNRLVTEYDHVLICGPVFPHEVAGFSGGTKYLFPGIAAAGDHPFHALARCADHELRGDRHDRHGRPRGDRSRGRDADTPLSLLALVVTHHGVAGMFCGDVHAAWRQAAISSRSATSCGWTGRSIACCAVMPTMYDDLWTAAKGAYKTEPAVADGGEVIIYAPHVTEVSRVHGRIIEEIGYHCRDYFLGQWERFKDYPGGILAHSTHVKGFGTYDPARRR